MHYHFYGQRIIEYRAMSIGLCTNSWSAAQLRICNGFCNGFPLISPYQCVGFCYNSQTPHKYVSSPCTIIFMANASTSTKLWGWDWAQTAGLLLNSCWKLKLFFSVLLITPHQSMGFGCYFVIMGRNITLTCHISFMVSAQTSPELYACAWA